MTQRSEFVWTLVSIVAMSVFVVFEHVTNADAIDLATQLERHRRMLEGTSEFYNPWQYRIFATWLLEGTLQIFRTVLPQADPSIAFISLRVVQNIFLFYLCLSYFKLLGIRSHLLSLVGLFIICLTMGNSTFHSDLSFNTYFDVMFYVVAGVLILTDRWMWIVILMIPATLNRETSALIPFMALAPFTWLNLNHRLVHVFSACIVFVAIFISLRLYYGFPAAASIHGMTSPNEFFVYNITFLRLYPLLFGTLGFLPIFVLLRFKELPQLLQHWFWLIIPVWMAVHLFKALAVETRLFLVPHVLIFVPAFLLLIQQDYQRASDPDVRNV